MPVSRYHPLLVALHWLLALLILGQLLVGALVLSELPDGSARHAQVLRLHMTVGLTTLALMIVRLLTRLFTARPPQPHASGGLRLLASVNHWLLYLVVAAMISTGLGMAQQGGLFPLLQGQPVRIDNLEALQPFAGHELFATVLIALVALHLAGVVWHYAKGEKLLARMWFGRRDAADAPALRSGTEAVR